MRTLIDTLYGQHRRMFALLALLEREIDAFAEGRAFDAYVVEAALDYIASYPDVLHRPTELLLYEAFRKARGGDDPLATAAASAEHETLGANTRELKNAVAAARGGMMPRDVVVTRARKLIDGLRHHMAHEEATILPAIRAALSAEDLAAVEAEIDHDPLIAVKRAEEFAFSKLFAVVTDMEAKGLAHA